MAYAADDGYARADSFSQYVHRIELYDEKNNKINPDDPAAPPYSPRVTCGKCHDYKQIAHGYHFNAAAPDAEHGRPGEPWVWTDARAGVQLPLSYRGWKGTYKPQDLGLSEWEFVQMFGRHMPGGGVGDEHATETPDARWGLSGKLAMDCMMCHTANGQYSRQEWSEQIAEQNYAWAPTAALGLGVVEGSVKKLPKDFDPAADRESGQPHLPHVRYEKSRFNASGEVFFDVIRKPRNDACYYCHSNHQPAGAPKWVHDQDLHLRAGMSCVDCHRNGLDHHTVRGFEGEKHLSGLPVATLSCRGCHMGDERTPAGRMRAPWPEHRGLPAFHIDRIACTVCHAGPRGQLETQPMQTALNHALGLPDHRTAEMLPGIQGPVYLKDEKGVYHANRVVWPAFWGRLKDQSVTPIHPNRAYEVLRRVLRTRKEWRSELLATKLTSDERKGALGEGRATVAEAELTSEEKSKLEAFVLNKADADFKEKLGLALKELAAGEGEGVPVYIAGGKAYKLNASGEVETFEHSASAPYAWPIAHNVRPAHFALGYNSCMECHGPKTPFFYGTLAATTPAVDASPIKREMIDLQGNDRLLMGMWGMSFTGHGLFKSLAALAWLFLGLVLMIYGVRGVYAVSLGGCKAVRREGDGE